MSYHMEAHWVSIQHWWQRGPFFSEKEKKVLGVWSSERYGKNMGILKREVKVLIIEFWRQRGKRLLQGFCHFLFITESLTGTDYVWHMLFGVWHSGYQQHIKCWCLNKLFYIVLPKPLLWLQLPSEGKASWASMWHKFPQMSVCAEREKIPNKCHSSHQLNTKGNAYKDYKVIIILKFEQEALLFQMFI